MRPSAWTGVAAAILLWGLAVPAAACELAGRVETDRLPIDGAAVRTVLGAEAPVELGRSGADGGFAFQIAPLPRDLAALRVVIEKGAAKGEYILRRRGGDGCPEPRPVYELPAATTVGNGAGTDAGEDLCVAPSALGRTIVLAPYQFFGSPEADFSRRFNDDLPSILYHRILAFQSRLGAGGSADITVVPICSAVSVSEGERIRRIGGQLNALAVVVGEGEVVTGSDGTPVVELDSVFRTIPVVGGHGGSPVTIGDKLPGERLRPSRAAEWLDDAWGKQVLFAYALRQIEGPAATDPAKLKPTRQLLIDMRKTMTAGDPFLPPLEALIATVEKAIGP